MAIEGTGKWSPSSVGTSVQNRDFYSGKKTVSSTSYTSDGTLDFDFGFAATGVLIRNPSATEVVYRWYHRTDKDNGTVPAVVAGVAGEVLVQNANKTGVRLRVEAGSAANVEVFAWG